jgi:hypothetical protein
VVRVGEVLEGVPFIGLGGGEEGALEAVGRHTSDHH